MTISLLRAVMTCVSAVQLVFAAGFAFGVPFFTWLWPFPGTTPLTLALVASFFAAAAASTLAALWLRNDAALAGIGLDYLVIFAPVAGYSLWLGATQGHPAILLTGVACVVAALFGLWLFLRTRALPFDASIPLPAPVRWSFALFITTLLIASALLVFRVPNVIPWSITPDLSVLIGFMFFGAMTYFAYGLLRPSWANAVTQLAGFLAYDVVLIGPFLARLGSLPPEFVTGQWVYLVVVVYSGALAVYYLFVNPETRITGRGTPRARLG